MTDLPLSLPPRKKKVRSKHFWIILTVDKLFVKYNISGSLIFSTIFEHLGVESLFPVQFLEVKRLVNRF